MGDFLFLLMYLTLMALVVFVPRLLSRFHVPAVVAIMITGIIIGPNAFDLLGILSHIIDGVYSGGELMTVIRALGLLGLVFLMALAGMEVDLRMLSLEKKAVTLLSILTFLIPSIAGYYVYSYFRPDDMVGKWVYASLFASHSVGIVFPVIRELGVTRTRFGVSVLSATVITDILSLVMLAAAIQYKKFSSETSLGPKSFSIFDNIDFTGFNNWFTPIYLAIIFLFIAICIWLIPLLWKTISEQISDGDDTQVTFFLLAVLIVVVCGEFLGINLIVGAFIAGLAVVRSKGFANRGRILQHKLEGIGFGLMIPFLFLMIGMDCKPGVLVQTWDNVLIAIFTVVGLIGSKVLSGWLAMRLSGFSHLKGLCAGLMTVPQLSATLAAAAVALQLKILDENFFNAIVVLSMVTTIPVPTMVRFLISHYKIQFDHVDIPGCASDQVSLPRPIDNP